MSLLTLPQTDGPDDKLPQGEERSEQFVIEVSEYFERLEVRDGLDQLLTALIPVHIHRTFRLPYDLH